MTVDEQIESALRQTGKPLEIAAAGIIRDQRQMIDYLKEHIDGLVAAFGEERIRRLNCFAEYGEQRGTRE